MRNEFLEERLKNLLGRYSPPRLIEKSPALQADEIRQLLGSLGRAAPQRGWEFWWDRFEPALLERMKTRAWPTVNEISRAAEAAHADAPAATSAQTSEVAIQYFVDNSKPHPTLNNPSITAEIVQRGLVDDIRDARFRGLSLSDQDSKRAKEMRPGADEWRRHVGVMSKIQCVSFAEAEAREIREMSPDQLPAHRA